MFDSYAEIFERRADSYQRAMARSPRARDAEFHAVVDRLDAGTGTVFDMPAGGGYLRSYLPTDKHYVAVEPTSYFFAQCPEGDGAERISSPVEAVPRPDGAADALISLAGLHHAPDLGAVFAEFRRLVRPGGMMVVADVGAGTPPDPFLNAYVHANSAMGHEGRFLDADTAPLLVAAGFDILSDAVVAVPWHFGDAREAGGYCADLFGIERRTPIEIADALAEIVGVQRAPDRFTVNWSLRRIVCRPAD